MSSYAPMPAAKSLKGSGLFEPPAQSSIVPATVARVAPSQVSKTYRQASQLFLTRRLPEALSTLLPLITPSTEGSDATGATEPAPVIKASRTTRIKVWSLYLTILHAILELGPEEGKDAFGSQEWRTLCQKVRDGDVWEEVVQFGYHGVEGDVDADVVINLATLLLSHARSQVTNQKRLETYLLASNDLVQDASQFRPPSQSGRSSSKGSTNGADTPRELNSRVKILELYTLHVLVRNSQWDYAKDFINGSDVLDEERKEAFLLALHSLREEQLAAQQRDREEQQRQEDILKKDIEESRRLRAENEAKERRRLEEERAKREASEVDYGIEQSPHASAVPKPAQRSPSTTRAKKEVASRGFGARAATIITNFQKILGLTGASFRNNPMLLMRLVVFVVGIITVVSRRDLRERIQQIVGAGWNKIKKTAGMGVKVSYI